MVPKSIIKLENEIIKCKKCPRLVKYRQEIAQTKRKSYQNQKYWGKPVPSFGDTNPKLLIVGLAPGAHGANRTGRIFTGDSSGDWLYKALYKNSVAKIPTSTSINDGQKLDNVRITCAVRCAPPDNKPTTLERDNCSQFLHQEIALFLPKLKSILALGSFAWSSTISALREIGFETPTPKPKFSHGASFQAKVNDQTITVIGSFHPSQQNTFTGKLTEKMLCDVVAKALNAHN